MGDNPEVLSVSHNDCNAAWPYEYYITYCHFVLSLVLLIPHASYNTYLTAAILEIII